MLTPQEVSSHAFTRAALGGYNMAMVDEFLDLVTADYTALYNDNAILKNKLKVLSDTVEEYRATDNAMRKTLLAAQKMADSMVADAESRKAELVEEAEEAARQRISELRGEIAAEEYRLQAAQEATAAYVAELVKLYEGQRSFMEGLAKLTPKVRAAETHVTDAASDIEDAMSHLMDKSDEPTIGYGKESAGGRPVSEKTPSGETVASPGEEIPKEAADEGHPDETGGAKPEKEPESAPVSARFDDLQFGKDYEIG